MKMVPVKSAALKAVGYDPLSKVLAIDFPGGVRWHYQGVSHADHVRLMQAESIGSHFHKHIREKGYQSTKVAG